MEQGVNSELSRKVVSHSGTYAMDEANYLFFGKSYNTDLDPDPLSKCTVVKFTNLLDNQLP
jgi:hypothetical protein